jgi:hypothetical protein
MTILESGSVCVSAAVSSITNQFKIPIKKPVIANKLIAHVVPRISF